MFDNEIEVYTILLAGGVGTRLWPLSRELLPKQFISLNGSDSPIQSTIKRLLPKIEFIVTLGVKPTYPETGYGYIEGGESINEGAFSIKRFVEKPDEKTAEEYIKKGNFFWNSGMFVFKGSVIMREFEAYEPALLKSMWHMVSTGGTLSNEEYKKLPTISFDNAIMEKTRRGVVIPSEFGWSDIGSWKSLYDFLPKDKDNNVIEGDVVSSDTRDCLIKSEGRLIVANCLRNIVVVETADAVLVSDLGKSKDIKSIVKALAVKGRREYQTHTKVYRPWGYYLVLEEKDNTKVKRIVVNPGARLSLQKHRHRSEHWVVVQGIAKV